MFTIKNNLKYFQVMLILMTKMWRLFSKIKKRKEKFFSFLFVDNFLLFCIFCNLQGLLYDKEPKKCEKFDFFEKSCVFGGHFWTENCFFHPKGLIFQQISIVYHDPYIFPLIFGLNKYFLKKFPCRQRAF